MQIPNEALALVPYHAEEYIQCGDISIATDSFGCKHHPPIVLIMGLSTQMIHWPEAFCRALANEGYWVIRFDNRDIGKSSILTQHKAPSIPRLLAHSWFKFPLNAPYQLENMAADVVHLMDGLGLEKAHVVGASMGGMIAQLMAIHHPQRVHSLTCIMSTTGEKKLMKPEAAALKLMAKKHKREPQAFIEQALALWQLLHGNHLPFPADHFREVIISAQQRGIYPSGMLRQLAAITIAPNRKNLLNQLSLPSLILHGNQDPLLKVHNAHALQEALPHAKLRVFDGMGHTLPQEYWQEMIAEINLLIKHIDA